MNTAWNPAGMNIELTTCCPLRCPQCYCTLEGGRHIPLQKALKALDEGRELGVEHVELSGGETLCYPHLYEVVHHARLLGIAPSISISGWGFDDECLAALVEAGIDGIHVSLNGPTEESNAKSRDGFDLALNALDVLRRRGFPRTRINWVMHRDTADLLDGMVALANEYQVEILVVMVPKPTAAHELDTYPTRGQIERVAQMVKRQPGGVRLTVETCFSQMLAIIGQNRFWGNLNVGRELGCTAGRTSLSVNVDGLYSPCRHLDEYESHPSMLAYWTKSPFLEDLRTLESRRQSPCGACGLRDNCRHCQAYNYKVNKALSLGNADCPVYREADDSAGDARLAAAQSGAN